jgi:hypothetical protein
MNNEYATANRHCEARSNLPYSNAAPSLRGGGTTMKQSTKHSDVLWTASFLAVTAPPLGGICNSAEQHTRISNSAIFLRRHYKCRRTEFENRPHPCKALSAAAATLPQSCSMLSTTAETLPQPCSILSATAATSPQRCKTLSAHAATTLRDKNILSAHAETIFHIKKLARTDFATRVPLFHHCEVRIKKLKNMIES